MDKDEVKIKVLKIYQKYGYLSYRLIFENSDIQQHHIKKYFENIKKICKELDIEYKRKNRTKKDNCKRCNKELIISKYSLNDFDRYCDDCKTIINNEKIIINNDKFNNSIRDYDYVECPACGYRAKTLEGHYRESNKSYTKCKFSLNEAKNKFGDFRIQAKKVDEKVKEKRRKSGWYRDEEKTLKKMSESAGHLKGQTKENSETIRKICKTKNERFESGEIVPHNKGKTKDNYEPLKNASINIKNSFSLRIDYEPGNSLRSFFTKEFFDNFSKDKKGRVKLNKILHKTGCSYQTIVKYLKKYDINYQHKHVLEILILNKLTKILGIDYKNEKTFKQIYKFDSLNRKRLCRYDGYFEKYNLIVEFHGYQHFIFPNHYHKTIEQFKKYKENDKFKKEQALKHGFNFLEIRYGDDLTIEGLRNKLINIGIIKLKKVA